MAVAKRARITLPTIRRRRRRRRRRTAPVLIQIMAHLNTCKMTVQIAQRMKGVSYAVQRYVVELNE